MFFFFFFLVTHYLCCIDQCSRVLRKTSSHARSVIPHHAQDNTGTKMQISHLLKKKKDHIFFLKNNNKKKQQ